MRRLLPIVLTLAALPHAARAAERLGYYRYPALHGDSLVFCAEGDLFRVPIQGGVAQRLTTHLANEYRPAVSPDGSTIAFSASYEGPIEVYTMPAAGGLPVRRTYDGGSALVVGWTPAGKILYATSRFSTLPETQLLTLDPKSGEKTHLPLAQASDGNYDPATGTLYFTRYAYQGSHTKRYKGGTAQNIWKLPSSAAEATPLTADYPGTSKTPLFWKGRLYFASDRDGTMNLWSMDLDGKDLKQLTRHVGFDVKDPSLSDGRIAYQLGADLHVYDVAAGSDRTLAITLVSDFDQMREKWIKKPLDYLTAAHLSPDGDRLVLTARGEIFVAPVKQGRFVEVRRKSGVRYRQARFLSGDAVAALSDESGETEWWKLSASGLQAPERLTKDGKVLRFDGMPSPDGKWIAHYDQDQELWLYNLDSKESRKIDFSPYWGYDGLAWSADSRWLAYSRPGDNLLNRIFVYDVPGKALHPVTTDRYDSNYPAWSPDGKWLYFLSDRNFRSSVGSPWGSRQPEPFFDQSTEILFLGLREGLRSPFAPEDELHKDAAKKEDEKKKDEKKDEKKKEEGKEGKKKEEKPEKVEITFSGIEGRLFSVPIPSGNYGALSVAGERLYWLSQEAGRDPKVKLMTLTVRNTEIEPKTVTEGVAAYELSSDGKKLLIRKEKDFHVVDAGQDSVDSAALAKGKVDLSSWTFPIDPREEWRQIFVESWRLERDYFYDRSMHGVDWKAMLDRYLPLVDRVTNRLELADLQAQMAGELSALHTFVGPGDLREGQDDVEPASLGAVLARDESGGGFRVTRLYVSDPDRPDEAGPLARPGVDVKEGDVLESIDGVPTLSVADPSVLLRNRAGKQVRIRVKPKGGAPRDVIVAPISDSQDVELRYDDWELSRRKRVDEASKGQIGYVHLRAMGPNDIAQWHRDFYPVFDRDGLIVDARHNRGGNIDSWILERLLRRPWFWWQPRVGQPYSNMQFAFRGHVVVLIDAFTASDGEAFAEGFRRLGLGKLIGTRTWGGEIWLSASNTLVDKGIVTAAEIGVYGPEGEWLIEGHGVEPDIVVDNLPGATWAGKDAQLDAAVEYLQKLIRDEPRPKPPAPKYPNKALPQPK